MAEAFEGELKISGVEDVIRRLDQLEAQLAQTGAAARGPMADGFKKAAAETRQAAQASATMQRSIFSLSKETKNAGRNLGGLINVGAEMAYSFGTAIPAFRGAATQMAMMGGTAYTLGAALGPIGAGIGLVVGVLPTLIGFLSDTSDEMKAAEGATKNFTISLTDNQRALVAERDAIAATISDLQRLVDARRQADRIAMGRGSTQEQSANLRNVQEQLRDARRALREEENSFVGSIVGNNAVALRREVQRLEVAEEAARNALEFSRVLRDEARQAESDKTAAEAESAKFARGSSGARGPDRAALEREQAQMLAAKLLETERRQAEELERAATAEREMAQAVFAKRMEMERIAELREQELEALAKQKELLIQQLQIEAERESASKVELGRKAAIQEEQEDQAKRLNRLVGGLQEGFSGVGEIITNTISLTEQGQMSAGEAFKTAIDEWLKQLAIQEAWKGAASLAEGIGNSILNPPAAASKYAEAAQHFAIAAAAGGASAAIPNSTGSGGGSSARPEATGGGGGGGGGVTNVYFNQPVATSELGAMQSRAGRAARRRNERRQ